MLPTGLFLIAIGYVLANLVMPFWAVCIAFLIVGSGAALGNERGPEQRPVQDANDPLRFHLDHSNWNDAGSVTFINFFF